MKKNLYFHSVYPRKNAFKEFCYRIFLSASSQPRLMLEVFIRKNFGERYFSITAATSIAIFLIAVPFTVIFGGSTAYLLLRDTAYLSTSINSDSKFWDLMFLIVTKFATWIAFTVYFIITCIKRYKETRRNPSVYDFSKYSLYSGDVSPQIQMLRLNFRFKLFNKEFIVDIENNPRTLRIFYEPAIFFIAGLLLMIFGQLIGYVIFYCSIIYSLGYIGAIHKSNKYILDIIDDIILSRQAKEAFINDKDPRETNGVEYICKKPNNKDLRANVASQFEQEAYVSFVY